MAKKKLAPVEVDFQVFALGSEEEFGAVRAVGEDELVVYVEDLEATRSFRWSAVVEVIEGKVIVDLARLDPPLREAIAAAHRDEDFPLKLQACASVTTTSVPADTPYVSSAPTSAMTCLPAALPSSSAR